MRTAKMRYLTIGCVILFSAFVLNAPVAQTTRAALEDWAVVLGGLPNPGGGFVSPVIACRDPEHCWVVVTSVKESFGFRTSDGGRTWESWNIPSFSLLEWVTFYDRNLGFAGCCSFGSPRDTWGVARTRDGGVTWERITDFPAWRLITANPRVAYLLGYEGTYRTTDGGDTWALWTTNRLPSIIQFLDENIAWATISGDVQRLAFTTDGGRSFTFVYPFGEEAIGFSSVHFLDYQNGWAMRKDGSVLRTWDAGQTWEILCSQSRACPYGVFFVSAEVGFGSSFYGIVRTTDGGKTWVPDGLSIAGVTLAKVNDRDHGWAVSPGQVWKRAPGLALTPTVTSTPVPGTTPTPTRTPFAPPVPTGTVLPTATPVPPGPCSWTGAWDTTSNQEYFRMQLTQSGASVSGTYGTDRRIEGTASGGQLTGRWAGPPTYSEPLNAGRFLFTVATDCNSFTGTWGYGSASSGGGAWSGVRVLPPTPTPVPRAQLVVDVYRSVLCREPDPEGLLSWVDSGLPVDEVRRLVEASPEGRRVSAVRAVYLSTLARDPLGRDCRGLRSWVDSGLSVEEIRQGLEASSEGQRVRGVRDLYIELLGRDPLGTDNAGLRYWVESPLPLEEVRRQIMASAEYRARVGGG